MSISKFKDPKTIQTTRSQLNAFETKLIALTIILVIFNVLDIELTLWGMSLHLIEEGNPLIRFAIEQNPLYLKGFKLLLPIILGTACWRVRNTSRKLIVYGLGLSVIVYLAIMMMHAHWVYTYWLL